MLKKRKITRLKFAASFLFLLIVAATFLFLGKPVLAGTAENMLWDGQSGNFQAASGLGSLDIRITIARIIRYVLGFMGVVAVLIVMYGGWVYMSSQGDESRIAQAKKIIINAVIGLTIITMSFGIATFIINRLYDATGSLGGGATGPGGSSFGLGASGNEIIESHYPTRDQTGVPRNTSIVITFKEPMNVDDLITAGNVNTTNVLIYRNIDGPGGPLANNFVATMTPDNRTVRYRQISPYMGSPTEDIWYTVQLTNAIRKANDDLAWPGTSTGYSWSFQLSTVIDITPPKIVSIIPEPDATEPRNVVVQINFNEPIDPISASGPTTSFNNITVNNLTSGGTVDGNFYISNLYQTVEFLTENACGVNSCGQTVYCLPGESSLNVLTLAANLFTIGESAGDAATGIVDMASNSLDGNSDGTVQGPQVQSGTPPYNMNAPDAATQGDDYTWTFATNNTVVLTGPVITNISPAIGATGISLDTTPEITFNRYLMSSSLTKNSPIGSGSVGLYADPGSAAVFYWITKVNGSPGSTVYINHAQFVEDSDYVPELNSGIKDYYQNCYYPAEGPGCTASPPAQPYCCEGALSVTSCAP